MFFNVMDVIFPIMFIVVAGFIVVTIIKGISQWNDKIGRASCRERV